MVILNKSPSSKRQCPNLWKMPSTVAVDDTFWSRVGKHTVLERLLSKKGMAIGTNTIYLFNGRRIDAAILGWFPVRSNPRKSIFNIGWSDEIDNIGCIHCHKTLMVWVIRRGIISTRIPGIYTIERPEESNPTSKSSSAGSSSDSAIATAWMTLSTTNMVFHRNGRVRPIMTYHPVCGLYAWNSPTSQKRKGLHPRCWHWWRMKYRAQDYLTQCHTLIHTFHYQRRRALLTELRIILR